VIHGNIFQGAYPNMTGMVIDNFDSLSFVGNYFEAYSGTTGTFVSLGPNKIGAAGMSGAELRANHIDFGNSQPSTNATAFLLNHVKGVSISNNSFHGRNFLPIRLTENASSVQIGPNVYTKEVGPKHIEMPESVPNLIILGD
jgi:hypothetical protein